MDYTITLPSIIATWLAQEAANRGVTPEKLLEDIAAQAHANAQKPTWEESDLLQILVHDCNGRPGNPIDAQLIRNRWQNVTSRTHQDLINGIHRLAARGWIATPPSNATNLVLTQAGFDAA
jgi:hypothetical protein